MREAQIRAPSEGPGLDLLDWSGVGSGRRLCGRSQRPPAAVAMLPASAGWRRDASLTSEFPLEAFDLMSFDE